MRSSLVLALLLSFSPLAASAAPNAPAALAQPPAGQVSLDLQNVPLRRVLDQLFQGTGQQFAVEPAVPNYPISMRSQGVPFETTLRTLLRLAPGVTYRKEGELFVIGMRTPQAELPAATVPPSTGTVVEIELPADAANQMQIQGESVTVSDGETQFSGDMRIVFGNGMRLQTHGARLTLEKDPSRRITRLRIEGPGR